MKNRQPNVAKKPTKALQIHARSSDVDGNVIPRCNAYRGSHRQEDIVVTSLARLVDCDACKAGLS